MKEDFDAEGVNVRAYNAAERDAMRVLFSRASAGSPGTALWGHTASEAAVYLDPYLELEPQSVLVAEVGGTLVGYLTGCRDSRKFPSETARMEAAVRNYGLYWKAKPTLFFARAAIDIAVAAIRRVPVARDFSDPRWPAHLHINLLPEFRSRGVGQALMYSWLEELDRDGSPGCHLGTLLENDAAISFFERCGFARMGEAALVPGMRYGGRHLHQVMMVRPASGATEVST